MNNVREILLNKPPEADTIMGFQETIHPGDSIHSEIVRKNPPLNTLA